VIAVVNYPNPYPQSDDVDDDRVRVRTADRHDSDVHGPLANLPGALTTIDQVFQKLNQTLKDAMVPSTRDRMGGAGYTSTCIPSSGHCMTRKVQIKTTVEHPSNKERFISMIRLK
jgi:hypothetical protein